MNRFSGFFLVVVFFAFPLRAAVVADESWSIHGQATAVPQGHFATGAPYTGPNSVNSKSEWPVSLTSTLYLGRALWRGAGIYLNPEGVGGSGLSGTHGLAGFSNGEIYRVDSPDLKAYLSRFFVRQTLDLGEEQESIEGAANQLATHVAVHRLTLTAGKFSLNDIFDNNIFAHDPRSQFLNWVFMDNGAWDYAADTRGYTYAGVVEYNEHNWALRFAAAMLPTTANGLILDSNLGEAHGWNAEVEYRYQWLGRGGKARLLGYANRANMGTYQAALAQTGTPDVTTTLSYRTKYGVGLNLEQELTDDLGAFARFGWSDGNSETWTFTEIDHGFSLGVSLRGRWWGRLEDTVGLGMAVNAISDAHAKYLQRGGVGFMLGDGNLNYDVEALAEIYYAFRPWSWATLSLDYQYVQNPGYNRDRSGISIFAGRVHLEI